MFEGLLENYTSTIARDLKLNLSRLFEDGALSSEEALLATLAVATSLDYGALAGHARKQLALAGLPAEQIQEAAESAALMGMLNTYYRFRHFLGNPEDYRIAGLRMTGMAKPILGKERLEMLAFAVSVINGCESCTRSHEKSLRDAGVPVNKVHDLAKLAAVISGLKALESAASRIEP